MIQRYGDTSVDVRYFINDTWTDNLEDMTDIGLFLLLDPKFKKQKEKIREYFTKDTKRATGITFIKMKSFWPSASLNKDSHAP